MSLTGKTVSHYEIVEEIGRGGMGVVYKARDLKLDRFVALKFLSKDLLANEDSRHRFINEAKTVSSLDHPNIATIHEIDETDEGIFISMGYYEGKTLSDYIAEHSPLPIDQILALAMQVAEGLAAAHRRGIVHRDIKPGNIMITEEGQSKILDFGLAKVSDQTAITQHGTIMGTAAYMSPEQIQGTTLDVRSDLFAFGVVLYEMLTNEQAFKGDYPTAVSYSIVHEEPIAVEELRADTPEPLRQIVTRCLEKDPENRFQSADEIATILRETKDGGPVSSKSLRSMLPGSLPRKGILWVSGAVAALLLVVVLFVFYRSAPSENGAKEGASVAILPFSYEGQDREWQWLGDAVAELITTELAQQGSIRVLDAQRRVRIMEALGLNVTSSLDHDQAIGVARKAHFATMITGRLAKTGEIIRVEAELYDSETGQKKQQFGPVQGTPAGFQRVATDIANQVGSRIGAGKSSKSPKPVSKTADVSLDVYRYYLEGRNAAFDRRYTASIERLQQAIELDSTFTPAYRWLSYAYNAIGESEKAKRLLKQGRPYLGNLPQADQLEYLANEAMVENRWRDYTAYLDKLLLINPYDAVDHFRYGWTLANKFRQLDAGIAEMQKALELDSTYTYAYNDLGYAFLEKGDTETALAMVENYVTTNPAGINPLDSKAEVLFYLGRYEEALSLGEQIIAMQPDYLSTYVILIRTYNALGRLEDADSMLKECMSHVAATANSASIGQSLKAEIELLRGNLDKAYAASHEATQIDPDNIEARWVYGRVLSRLSDRKGLEEQISFLQQSLVALGGLDQRWLLHHLQAELSLIEGKPPEAISSYMKALQLGPRDRSFYLLGLGLSYERNQDPTSAIQQYQAALSFNANNAQAVFALAQLHEKQGEGAKAIQMYRRLADLWADAAPELEPIRVARSRLASI